MKKTISVVLVVIIVVSVVYLIRERNARELAREQAAAEIEKARLALVQKNAELKKRIAELEEELTSEIAGPDTEKMAEVFGETEVPEVRAETRPEPPAIRVEKFFGYLDRRGYLPAAGIRMSAADYCMSVFARLRSSRPVIVGETRDLYALIKNITFFFRVLGKKDLKALKIILENESGIMEQTAEMFYGWITAPENRDPGMPSFEMLYDYAAYFLNTIAGQAYLFRRGSQIRLLTAYYSLLILDEADQQGLNRYGIDIRPHLVSTIREMENYRLFVNGKTYLDHLREMRKKYDNRG